MRIHKHSLLRDYRKAFQISLLCRVPGKGCYRQKCQRGPETSSRIRISKPFEVSIPESLGSKKTLIKHEVEFEEIASIPRGFGGTREQGQNKET